MKKIFALILTLVLAAAMLAGCTGDTVVIGNCTCSGTTCGTTGTTGTNGTTVPAEGAVKTGLSVSISVSDSVSATESSKGAAKYDITLAAVTVDDNGVITSCIIDAIPATIEFDTTGNITTDLTAAILTKNELGADYGMVAWGGAIAEWNEQVAAVAEYAVGKTVQQLKNGDINMTTGKAEEGSDLSSSATIYLAGYVYAIEAAVNNAQHLGAQAGDELVLSTLNTASSSVAGTAQLDADITVLTRKDGVITSCIIDSVQAKIAFDTTGKITTDLTAPFLSKNDLGADYGMVAWGGAMAEWNVQAAAFARYVTGKTAAEVADISITEATKPADGTDLSTSVTIAIGGFQALIAKAMQA